MPRANKLVVLICQLRTVERMLISGCTAYVLADTLGISVRQVRRFINDLKSLGVQIQSDYTPGEKSPATHRAKKSTAVFR